MFLGSHVSKRRVISESLSLYDSPMLAVHQYRDVTTQHGEVMRRFNLLYFGVKYVLHDLA